MSEVLGAVGQVAELRRGVEQRVVRVDLLGERLKAENSTK